MEPSAFSPASISCQTYPMGKYPELSSTSNKRNSTMDVQKRRRFCEISSCDAVIDHRSSFKPAAIDIKVSVGLTFVAVALFARAIIAVEIELASTTEFRRQRGVVIADDRVVVMEVIPFLSGGKDIRSSRNNNGDEQIPSVGNSIRRSTRAFNCITTRCIQTSVVTAGSCADSTGEAITTLRNVTGRQICGATIRILTRQRCRQGLGV